MSRIIDWFVSLSILVCILLTWLVGIIISRLLCVFATSTPNWLKIPVSRRVEMHSVLLFTGVKSMLVKYNMGCCCGALQVRYMYMVSIPVLVGAQVDCWQCCWRQFAFTISVWEQIVAQASENVKLGIVEVLTMQSVVWRHAIFVDNNIVNEGSLLYCIWPELCRNV